MKIVFTLQNMCIPVGVHMFFLFNTNISIPISPNDPTRSLNLPRIATQSILGFGRWRFGRVCERTLLSPAAPVLCFTEQLSSPAPSGLAISPMENSSCLFKPLQQIGVVIKRKPPRLVVGVA